MISLKDLRESQKNKKELSGSTENNNGNTSVYGRNFDNLEDNDDVWIWAILWLICMQEHENEKLWKSFQEEIRHNNRFFPKSELLEKVDNISEYASVKLCKDTVLYRAREYKSDDYLKNREVVAFYEKLNELFPDLKLQLEDIKSDSAMKIIAIALSRNITKMEELRKIITEVEILEKPFWGFCKEDCDAPPKDRAVAGRANSAGISFLYVATDEKTAIMEMRPQIGQCFNVCKIEICRNILIFDFTYAANEMKEDDSIKSGDLYAISKEFSYPNYGNPEDYIPTQYLCEYLRQKGFDGIRYKSSVSPEGTNLIIFDTNSDDKPYKILESRIFEVENIDIKFEQIIPIEPNRFQDLQKKE